MSLSVLNSGGGGGSRVTLDGERVKELAMTSYKGANPYTMGQEGMSFEANTLIKNALQIVNGVSRGGQYVWRILTAEGGDFAGFIVSDEESAYPDGGMQDGHWYERYEPQTYLYGSEDLTAGTSTLKTGQLYFVYDTVDLTAGVTELETGKLCFVYE